MEQASHLCNPIDTCFWGRVICNTLLGIGKRPCDGCASAPPSGIQGKVQHIITFPWLVLPDLSLDHDLTLLNSKSRRVGTYVFDTVQSFTQSSQGASGKAFWFPSCRGRIELLKSYTICPSSWPIVRICSQNLILHPVLFSLSAASSEKCLKLSTPRCHSTREC